jgi:hypothetical protein
MAVSQSPKTISVSSNLCEDEVPHTVGYSKGPSLVRAKDIESGNEDPGEKMK